MRENKNKCQNIFSVLFDNKDVLKFSALIGENFGSPRDKKYSEANTY
jgi:hypothetical protein